MGKAAFKIFDYNHPSSFKYTFRIGDPVWAKMKGFSAWPGKVDMPPDHIKRPPAKTMMHCVFFFGTHDYGWIPETDLKPYEEFKSKFMSSKKSVKKAADEIEAYIAGGCKATSTAIVASAKPTPKKKTPAKKPANADQSATDDDAEEDEAEESEAASEDGALTPSNHVNNRKSAS